MVRKMMRTFLAVGAVACLSPMARAAEPTVAEKEGARLIEVGTSEEKAAQSDLASAEEMKKRGKAMEETAEKNKDKAAEASASQLQKKAKALKRAAEARHDSAEDLIQYGKKLQKEGLDQKSAEENAKATPSM
jgi:hypothetical protein